MILSDPPAETAVLIAGAGPVGLSLAVELGRRGVACLLVEQTPRHHVGFPTTNNLSIRTMEHLRRWGLADRVRQAVAHLPYARVWLTAVGGHELARNEYPPNGAAVPLPWSPETFVWAPKPFFDPLLADLARSYGSVALRFGLRLEHFEQDADGVTAALAASDGGAPRTVRARYLIGCDGAGSVVRRQAGLERVGLFADRESSRGLSAYFRAPGLTARLPLPVAHAFLLHPRYRNSRGEAPLLVSIDGQDGWRISIPPPADGSEIDLDAYLHALLGPDQPVAILDTTRGTVDNRAVNRHYRAGRVFVAGDAAHISTPRGGLGANTGMQDAIDLGWKLAAVVLGWGGAGLLDSYEVERRPVALALMRYQGVDCSGAEAVALPTPIERLPVRVPPDIDDATPAAAATRRRIGREIWRVHHGLYDHPGLELGYRYDDSPLCVPDGTPPPPDELTGYTQTARPGARAPHAWLARGLSTLDLFGDGFTLLRTGGGMDETDALERAAAARGVPLRVADVHWQEVWTLYERRFTLVRPDGMVAWRADESPDDPLALVDRVRGAGPSA